MDLITKVVILAAAIFVHRGGSVGAILPELRSLPQSLFCLLERSKAYALINAVDAFIAVQAC